MDWNLPGTPSLLFFPGLMFLVVAAGECLSLALKWEERDKVNLGQGNCMPVLGKTVLSDQHVYMQSRREERQQTLFLRKKHQWRPVDNRQRNNNNDQASICPRRSCSIVKSK